MIGRTTLQVTRLGLGGAHLARPGDANGPPAEASDALIRRALELGVRYFDTAPLYGIGESEQRVGGPLREMPRDEIVVSTKVGRVLDPSARGGWRFDFSRDAVLRCVEASLERLGLDRIDILYVHDADDHFEEACAGAFPALVDLRAQGVVRAIGAGMNQWEMELRFAKEFDLDVFLLAGRYTLLEQGALDEFLPYCEQHQISVVAGGPYNSGILANPAPGATYNYRPAPAALVERARLLGEVCARHRVPLKAAALQFVLAHPAVAAVIPGAQYPSEVEENVAMTGLPIPAALWADLKSEGLLAEDAPTPM